MKYPAKISVDLTEKVHFQAPAFITRAWIEKQENGESVRKLEMLASGVKVDAYDDRMSENAVKEMSVGMVGKDFLPEHCAEWDEILGMITDGRVDDQYQYFATAELHPMGPEAIEKADTLFAMVQAGRTVGVSIAGWIRRVMFEDDEYGRHIRVIDSIECDHIAVTRSPAYQDAHIIGAKAASMVPFLVDALDKSPGSFPSLPDALRAIVPKKHYPLAPEDTPWSFTAAEGNAIIDKGWPLYKAAHTWFDDADGSIPETKDAYKLPHHKLVDDTFSTVWRGCAAAMAVCLGARGGMMMPDGSPMPDEERGKIYAHLKYHYGEFGKDVPEFASIQPTLLRWNEYLKAHQLTEAEIEDGINIILRGEEPPCLTKEMDDMDMKELAELLAKQNEAVTSQITAALNPMAEGMRAILESQAALKAQSEETQRVALEAKRVVEEIAGQPQRVGKTTATDPETRTDEGEDFLTLIVKETRTPEFGALRQRNPMEAFRRFVDSFTDSTGRNHMLDIMREQGAESPLGSVSLAPRGHSWETKVA